MNLHTLEELMIMQHYNQMKMLQKQKKKFKAYNRKLTVDCESLNDAVADQLFISNNKKKKKKNNKD